MKKWHVRILAALAVMLLAGCGVSAGQQEGEDTVDSGMLSGGNSRSTPEMDSENEKVQKPADTGEKTEGEDARGQIILNPEDLREPEIAEQEVTEEIPVRTGDGKLQIVFLGDSILDGYRNETGIAYLTGVYCNADVYNLAMGGTTAALTTYESGIYSEWTSRSLQGVVHVICGNVSPSILDGYRAREIYDGCDFSQTDYFVVEYGVNDFLSNMPINDDEDFYDEYTYVGALRIAVQRLNTEYPGAAIVLCSPTYAHFWAADGSYLGDGNMSSNGIAPLVEYHKACRNVANDMHTLFFDGYEGMGLDAYTADEYLEDGLHLSAKGREVYAQKLSRVILNYEDTRNN